MKSWLVNALSLPPFFRINLEHTTYDAFWQARSIWKHFKGITPAVLTVGGWYDAEDLYGIFNTYQTVEKQNPGIFNVLVVGPYGRRDRSEDQETVGYFLNMLVYRYRGASRLLEGGLRWWHWNCFAQINATENPRGPSCL